MSEITKLSFRFDKNISDGNGLLLSFLSSVEDCLRKNSSKPLNFFLRERLSRKEKRSFLRTLDKAISSLSKRTIVENVITEGINESNEIDDLLGVHRSMSFGLEESTDISTLPIDPERLKESLLDLKLKSITEEIRETKSFPELKTKFEKWAQSLD